MVAGTYPSMHWPRVWVTLTACHAITGLTHIHTCRQFSVSSSPVNLHVCGRARDNMRGDHVSTEHHCDAFIN